MKKAIVTGGTGFIGSWLVQELLEKEIHVTVIVRNKEKLLDEFKNNSSISIIEKEIEDISVDDFDDIGYDVFFHLG